MAARRRNSMLRKLQALVVDKQADEPRGGNRERCGGQVESAPARDLPKRDQHQEDGQQGSHINRLAHNRDLGRPADPYFRVVPRVPFLPGDVLHGIQVFPQWYELSLQCGATAANSD